MAALVGLFFNPIVRLDATFSTVGNLQRHMYPWQDPGVPQAAIPPGYAQSDQAEFVHPRQEFIDDTLRRDRRFPLWEPLTFAGQPFFAANGSRLAYPPFLALAPVFDATWTQDLHLMLHLFAAGLAMFALLKGLGARFGGAMLAGVSWAFSSYVMAWALFGAIPVVAALLPLAVLLVRRAHDRRSWRLGLAAGAVLALLYLGSSVEVAFLSWLLVFGYAVGLALWRLVVDRRSTSALQKVALCRAGRAGRRGRAPGRRRRDPVPRPLEPVDQGGRPVLPGAPGLADGAGPLPPCLRSSRHAAHGADAHQPAGLRGDGDRGPRGGGFLPSPAGRRAGPLRRGRDGAVRAGDPGEWVGYHLVGSAWTPFWAPSAAGAACRLGPGTAAGS